jgi:hypothetical protein
MQLVARCLFFYLVICCLVSDVADVLGAAGTSADKPQLGGVVNIAPYGRKISGRDFVGVEWENPRDVYEVRICGIDKQLAESLRLEWWGGVWPASGTGGWMRLDDPWNGRWVRVDTEPELNRAGQFVFKLPPLTKAEWDKALNPGQYPSKNQPVFRRTLKVRITGEGQTIPSPSEIVVFGQSRWHHASFDIETQHRQDGTVAGRIEVVNGVLGSVETLPEPRLVKLSGTRWTANSTAGGLTGVRIGVLYAANEDLNSNDMTRITVCFGQDAGATGFSFVPQDVLKDGSILVPDFCTLVSKTSLGLTFRNYGGPASKCWDHRVRKRLQDRPEMTRATAMAGIPRLAPARWIPLGVPSARQEFFVGPNGDWMISALSLNTDKGQDARRWAFKKDFGRQRQWDELYAMLDTGVQPKFDGADREDVRRYLEDGYLPVVHVEWRNGPLCYHHALFATVLLGEYGDDVARRGDETVVLLSKLRVTNTGNAPQTGVLSLRYSIDAPLTLQDDGVIAVQPTQDITISKGLFAVRGLISMDKPAGGEAANWSVQPSSDPVSSEVFRWQESLRPQESRSIYFKMPFVELVNADELTRLKEISFEKEVWRVLDYWRRRLSQGMQIEVPDEAINNFYKANLWHNLITTDRDPDTGLYNQGVATVRYRVFANETVMVARSMDMRGEHVEAERFIEPMLYYQGREPLKGRFSTKKGVFHSAGDYTHGEYAMNHGFVLWGAAEHYLITRDQAYLERVAPKLIEACDFLISQRRSTMGKTGAARPPIHGLSPASSLEDVVEYQYWFATNAYFYLGMKRAAQALADIAHPQAKRIATEAEKYRRDIEVSVRQATSRSAVVRLLDGSYIPYVPSRVYQWRHLTEGWIREALYCALHLATAEVLCPDDPVVTWMLDDLEDNIFFSRQSGYNVSDYEKHWFEWGGITLQPCLLDTPIVYMARNEIAAALRAFWNTYALLIYPDVQCFAEWARSFGVGGGPVYKTSDESRFVMWLRQLLIWENAQQLWLGRATPRQWLEDGKTIRVARATTTFGPTDMIIHSRANEGRIYAELSLPARNPPSEVWLRLRHPESRPPIRVLVNERVIEPERIVGSDIRLLPGVENLSRPVRVVAEYERE